MKKTLLALFLAPVLCLSARAVGEALEFDFSEPFGGERENTISMDDVFDFQMTTVSNATITISGLPTGIFYDKGTYRIYGQATMPGKYLVKASGTNSDKFTYSQVFYVTVSSKSTASIEVSDCEGELFVGEQIDSDWPLNAEDYFTVGTNASGAAMESMTVTGLPSGLAYTQYLDDEWTYREISGTPLKAGVSTVKCVVTFSDKTIETAYALFYVNGPDPEEYGVDFSELQDLSVGDTIAYFPTEGEYGAYIGSYEYYGEDGVGYGITSISGQPTGLTVRKVRSFADDDGSYCDDYYVSGMPTAPGLFSVNVKSGYYDFETDSMATANVIGEVIVKAVPDRYVSVAVFEPDSAPGCKVTGTGVYKVGKAANLTATAARDFVFAGWCDSAGLPILFPAMDYRTARMSCTIGVDTELDLYAKFILKTADYLEFGDLEGLDFALDSNSEAVFREPFTLGAGSLPTLTFKNLPAGVTCVRSLEFADGMELYYDPALATASTTPKPGRYDVIATAKNQTLANVTAKFRIVVSNWTNEYIAVQDDYGVLTPNIPMDPIFFTNAVAEGWSLSVTGNPTGTRYDANSKSLSGIPTVPGEYTLTFTAKCGSTNAVSTAFIKVKDFPTLKVDMDADAAKAGNKVTGAGSFKKDTKVTLKATAAKGWVFAGWTGLAGVEGFAALNPSQSYVMTADDMTVVEAQFIELRDDWLDIEAPVDETNAVVFVVNELVQTNLIATLIDTGSYPTITVTGLPTGLSFDKNTYLIKGKPTKTGVWYATIAVKNAGGYTFTRIVRFAVLAGKDDPVPADNLKNDAAIDFSDLDGWLTGDYLPSGDVESLILEVPVHPTTGAKVTKVTVAGLPAGLKYITEVEEGVGYVEVYGTPTKPSRNLVKITATYDDRKTAMSEYGMIVQDGGSAWLEVVSVDELLGTVSGSGVYASGATVRLGATAKTGNVFGGWWEDEVEVFANLEAMDGIDYRTAGASFVFRRNMFLFEEPELIGYFAAKDDDAAPVVEFAIDDTWEINPSVDSATTFTVDTLSLPKFVVTGCPKGVTCDPIAGVLVYDSSKASQVVPGYYTISIKVTNLSNRSTTAKLSVFVANKETDVIGGLDSAADAYQLSAGVSVPEIIPEVDLDEGWTLSMSGQPSGVKLVADKVGTAIVGYHLEGVPARACTNTVTFTATRTVGRIRETAVATITMQIAALPVWAQGNFNGVVYDSDTNAVGSVSLDVTAAGKVSGKLLVAGKTITLNAAAFDSLDTSAGEFTVKAGDFQITVGVDANGNGRVEILGAVGEQPVVCGLVQNLWKRKVPGIDDFKAGTKSSFKDLTCTFAAGGAVTFAGKIDGVVISGGKSQVLLTEEGSAFLVLYIANTKLPGGWYCQECSLKFDYDPLTGKINGVTITEIAHE